MRRPPVLVLTLALFASALGLASTASATPPGTTPEIGFLGINPDPPVQGEPARLAAYFPDGSFTVTFYKQTGTDSWQSIGSDQTGRAGNAFLDNYVLTGEETIYARKTSGGEGRTQVRTITPIPPPPITPGPDVGNLSTSPTTYVEGDTVSVKANFPSGSFSISLYKESAPNTNTWTKLAQKPSNTSGNATFSYVVNGTAKLFARKSNGDSTEVDLIAPTPKLDFDLQRDCTGNTCANTATATGTTDPAQEGRVFKLQVLNGTTWTQVGSDATSGADGKAEIPLDLTGLPQWSARSYRLVSAGTPALTSDTISFMPGPTELGSNVLRIDVDKGIFPTAKGPEYTGDATLSVDGVVQHDSLELESFGVRGTSTANFNKRAYKLKFLNKPPKIGGLDTSVFGMERAKSWSLLANYLDRSQVRDKVGLELGRAMDHIFWTPDSRHVELFVNDQYRGAYLFTESVKIDGDRVDVDEEQGMIMETDGKAVEDPLLEFVSSKGIYFEFKDPDERKGSDPTGVTTAKFNAIRSRINAFESKLYSSTTREQYPTFIDVPSAIDFYFVKEFTKDRDADFYRSNYFSWDPSGRVGEPLSDGKFHFGPAWDFDRSAGITSEDDVIHNYVQSPEGFYLRGTTITNDHPNYKTHWFVQLFKSQSFKNAANARWAEVRQHFAEASDVARDAATALGVGAENDLKRWPGQRGKYAAHANYQAELEYVAGWYDDRFAWMDQQF